MQSFVIFCEDEGSSLHQVFEVANRRFVNLNKLQRPLSSDQLWYRKDEPSDGSFAIVSMSNGRALKCSEPEASQVVLHNDSEKRDLWVMEGSYIVCKRTSQFIYADSNKLLYCGDEIKKSKETTKSFKFLKVVCTCTNNCCHG